MAEFPSGVYNPRTKENKTDVVYTPAKKTLTFAEDITKLDDEVVAVETFLSPKKMTLRPEINIDEIKKSLKPTQVQRGIFFGYSLPVYDADNEELFFVQKVPERWDGASDIRIKISVALSSGEDVGNKFKMQNAWEHIPCGGIIPDTANNVEVETTILVGQSAQYDMYCVTFVVDYDIDGAGNEIKGGELLAARLRRIAASELEASNEIIIFDWIVEYQRDKFGVAF